MSKVMHYVSISGHDEAIRIRGSLINVSEYVVITDDDESTGEEFCRQEFELNHAYEIERTGILPTDTVLIPD